MNESTTNDTFTRLILIVEDQAIIAMSTASLLERQGFGVRTVYTATTALEVGVDPKIDLILMDIDLGDAQLDGTQVARRILTMREVPIVFLTSHAERSMVEKVKGITRYGYVLKEAGEFVLMEAIRMAFELFSEHRELQSSRDLYRSIANLTGDIIVRHDADGNWTFLNDRAHEAWGIPYGDISDMNYLDYVRGDDLEATRAAAVTMRESQQEITGLVNRVKTVSGWRTYVWNSAPIFDGDGNYAGFQSTGRDITNQER